MNIKQIQSKKSEWKIYLNIIISFLFIIVNKFHQNLASNFLKKTNTMLEDILITINPLNQQAQINHTISRPPQLSNEELQIQRAYRSSLEDQAKKINSKNHGLSSRFMKQIKNMKMGKSSQTCSICISQFAQDQIIKRLPCKHIFHRECAKSWLKINKTCPVCRMDLQKYFEQLQKEEKQEILS